MTRFFGLLILLAAGIGAYFCITSILWQHQANTQFTPVSAQLLDKHIASHRGSKGGTTYSPEASYRYAAGGRTWESSRVLAIRVSTSSRSWAEGVLGRILPAPEGTGMVTAFIDPQNPAEAILVRDYSFFPYGFGMGTLFAAAVGLGMLGGVIGTARTKMAAVALDDSGWQLLLPQAQLRKQYRNALLWLIGGTLAILPMPAHWIVIAGQGGLAALIGGVIALAVIAGLAVLLFRRWSVSHHLSDARLRIRPAPMCRGEPLALDVSLDAYAPLRIAAMTARILCLEHYKEQRDNKCVYGTRTHAEKTVPLSGPAAIPAGGEVTAQGEINFDRSLPPTTDITIKNYPYYTWEIRLSLVLEGMVDYAAVFPLEAD